MLTYGRRSRGDCWCLGDCENLSLEYSGFLIFLCDLGVKHSSRSSCAAAVKIGRRGKV